MGSAKPTKVTIRFSTLKKAEHFIRLVEADGNQLYALADHAQHGGAEGDDYETFKVMSLGLYS